MDATNLAKQYTFIVAVFIILMVASITIFVFTGQLNRNATVKLSAGSINTQEPQNDYSWSNTKLEQIVIVAPRVQQIVRVEE